MATASATQERAAELNILSRKQRSLWGDAVYRLFRNKAAVAGLITGSFIIETFFSVPGIGREYVRSILALDYPVIMATTLLYAFFIVVANLSVDLVYGMLDPRIKVAK